MDKPLKIIVPDEQVQVGTNAEGHPVYIDLKDTILTGEEKDELQHNRLDTLLREFDTKLVDVITRAFNAVLHETLMNIVPDEVCSKGVGAMQQWAADNDINTAIDEQPTQITLIIRKGDRVLRECPIRFRRPTKASDEDQHAITT